MIQFTKLPLAALEPNTGQIEGLPSNPRQWTQKDIDKIAKSLKETPELFEARPIIVYPFKDKYVILGGNLRYAGSMKDGNMLDEVPVAIIPEDTPVEKMQEIVIKDNGTFGSWDYDALANEWDVPLLEWGVPAWDTGAGEEESIPENLDEEGQPKPFVCKITFPDADSMTDFVKTYKNTLEDAYKCTISESGGYL